MNFYIINHNFKYEAEKVARLFLPFEKFQFIYNSENDYSDDFVFTEIVEKTDKSFLTVQVKLGEKYESQTTEILKSNKDYHNECERLLAVNIFRCFEKITGYYPKWGILTGIRPARLLARLIEREGEENGLKAFKEKMLVTDKKAQFCYKCLKSEEEIIGESKPNDFSLYISIPFCPSRCYYCSFVSHSVESAKDLIPTYVQKLIEEIKYTAEIAKKCNLNLSTVYIGGGTPTTLSAEQLGKVMKTVTESFDMSNVKEFTVEAGRPDTIDKEKLECIKQNGATRISINPQTMSDEVLKNIGRKHTVGDFINCFKMARSVGFRNINTDLIVGLNGDTAEGFMETVDKIISLDPESVTIHALSVKRSANLNKLNLYHDLQKGIGAESLVEKAKEKLESAGILPYYMYRQGKTVGNLENVGYAKKGYEGIYNIYIMDETHTILACGASATSKLKQPNGKYIERIFNFKYPYEYLNGFDEMLERKKKVTEFYDLYNTRN